MTQRPTAFPLIGGMDVVTSAITIPPGRVIASLNYEPTASGYKRLTGFERFDGHVAPSSGYYSVVHFTAGDPDGLDVAIGDTITRGGWTGIVAIAPVVSSGTFAAGTAAGYVVVVQSSGTFAAGALSEGATQWASATTLVENEAVAAAISAAGQAAIRTALRARIGPVTGSGAVLGTWFYNNDVLGVRDAVGHGSSVIYRASETGWTPISLVYTMAFTSGGATEITAPLFDNGTDAGQSKIVGASSSAVGNLRDVSLASGSWAGGDAAGTFTFVLVSGVFGAENVNFVVRGPGGIDVTILSNAATVSGPGVQVDPLEARGTYRFMNHNFFGATNLFRMYGVNGVNQGFEYDITTFSLKYITTGMAQDKPVDLAEHNGAMFLSFLGGSVQYSAPGDPHNWNPILGPGEIGVGSEVTAMIPANKSTLAILAENSINVLYGHDSTDYLLETLTDQAGAIANSAQRIGQVVYLDNGGLRSLSAAATFGNFNFGSLSLLIAPLLEEKRAAGIGPAASFVSREKNQYWLIFSDGTGIVGYLGRKSPEFMAIDLGITVTCASSVEIGGVSRIFLGASDGYVYELGKGTSFDGSDIPHYIELPYCSFGSPQLKKRAHKVIVDLQTSGTTTLTVEARFDNGVDGVPAQDLIVTNGSGALDSGEAYLSGAARNLSLKIAGSTNDEEPHVLTGITYLLSPRGLKR